MMLFKASFIICTDSTALSFIILYPYFILSPLLKQIILHFYFKCFMDDRTLGFLCVSKYPHHFESRVARLFSQMSVVSIPKIFWPLILQVRNSKQSSMRLFLSLSSMSFPQESYVAFNFH